VHHQRAADANHVQLVQPVRPRDPRAHDGESGARCYGAGARGLPAGAGGGGGGAGIIFAPTGAQLDTMLSPPATPLTTM
jgi:hypothetical protein